MQFFMMQTRDLQVMCPQSRLTILVQGLMFISFASFVLIHTNILEKLPSPAYKWSPYSCEDDFGYSNISLKDIQYGAYNPNLEHRLENILNANKTCLSRLEVFLLILVKSAVGHFKKRRYIRETWGKDALKRGYRLAFILGYNENDDIFVNYENEVYEDLIQYNFNDTYDSNTKKIKMALLWILEFCAQAKHIVIADDDMYVNIPNTVRYFRQTEKDKNLYSGYLIEKPRPNRDPDSKHYISEARYPFDCYPPYIAGGSIFLNQRTVKMFVRVMPFIPELPFDDVFVGFLAQKSLIKPSKTTLVRLDGHSFYPESVNDINYIITKHGYENDEMFRDAHNETQKISSYTGDNSTV